MELWICEKPDQARHVADRLGVKEKGKSQIECQNGKVVTWCFGHLLELMEPGDYDPALKEWTLAALPFMPEKFRKSPISSSKKQFEAVVGLIRKADSIVHCGDPDPQGQLLVQEVIEHTGYKGPVKRCLVNDLTPSAIDKSIASLRDNAEFEGMYQGELAWQYADWVFGMNVSRLVTLLAQAEGFSLPTKERAIRVGRVKSAIVTMVINRYNAHNDHKKSFFWTVTARATVGGIEFPAKYVPGQGDEVDSENRLTNEAAAKAIAAEAKGKEVKVVSVETKTLSERPPLPFNLIKLQAEASKAFKMRPKHVLDMVQSLYEKHRLLTYPRSDCPYLPEDQHPDAPKVMAAIAETCPSLGAAVDGADASIKGRAFDSERVSSHHAIIPTAAHGDWGKLSEDEQKIYRLCARAYVAQFMPPAEYEATKATLDIGGRKFVCSAKVMTSPGWKTLYSVTDFKPQEGEEPESDEVEMSLKDLKQGATGKCGSAEAAKGETKPPAYYTMASLLLDLTQMSKYLNEEGKKLLMERDAEKEGESGGIGTPATRSDIIAQLFDNAQIKEEKKGKSAFIVPTEQGLRLYSAMPPKVKALETTAYWYELQKKVVGGEMDVMRFVKTVYDEVAATVEEGRREGLSLNPDAPKCPKCGRPLRLIDIPDKNAHFWGCSGFREGCDYAADDDGGKPGAERKPRQAPALTDYKCPKCGKPMVKRTGPKGDFYGCSDYPRCRAAMEIGPDGEPVERKGEEIPADAPKCPKCGKPMLRRPSKDGKGFWWGCTGWKDGCDYTAPDEDGKPGERKERAADDPNAPKCPKCGKTMRRRHGTKGDFYGCPGYPDCEETMDIDADGKPVKREKKEGPQEEKAGGKGRKGAADTPKGEGKGEEKVVKCPDCGEPLTRRPAKSGNGFWWGCTGWKSKGCNSRFGDKNGEPDFDRKF